jgi:hypothetical protein
MIATLLLVATAQAAAALPKPPISAAPVEQQGDIVVRARALKDTEVALAECVARKCPTDQDVDATIKHAEGQVLAGDYLAARRTLAASIGRNKGQAKAYPVPVSDLYLTQSRISQNLGERTFTRRESIEAVRALRAGLKDDDRLILIQRIENADTRARIGDWETAVEFYRDIERDARNGGRADIATYTKFKLAVLYGALAERQALFAPPARQYLKELIAITDPALQNYAKAARVLAGRLTIKGPADPAITALIAETADNASPEPALLVSPPIRLYEATPNDRSVTGQITTDKDYRNQWINVGFRVQPDGQVGDVQLLDRSGDLNDWWVPYVTASIQNRRYAPLSEQQRDHATRVERYTMTAFWGFKTGSRVRQRTPEPYVQVLDITPMAVEVAAR